MSGLVISAGNLSRGARSLSVFLWARRLNFQPLCQPRASMKRSPNKIAN